MGRSGVDDPAPLARLHAGQRGADRMEGRAHVDRDDLVPLLDREFLDRRDELDAGIVDEDVDRAELALGIRDHLGDLVALGHVGGRIERLDAELGLDAGPLLFDRGGIAETVDHQRRAFARESPRDRQADTAGRTRYDSNLALQRHGRSLPPVPARKAGPHLG